MERTFRLDSVGAGADAMRGMPVGIPAWQANARSTVYSGHGSGLFEWHWGALLRIQQAHLAQGQLANARLDLGAVTHHYPDQTIRMNHFAADASISASASARTFPA